MIKIRFVNPDKPNAHKAHKSSDSPVHPSHSTKGAAEDSDAEELSESERAEKEHEIASLVAEESRETSAVDASALASSVAELASPAVTDAERAWLHALHWRANPFRDMALEPFREYFVGRHDARRALGLIVRGEGRFAIIEGPRGTGTSSLLRWLGEELKEHESAFRIVVLRAPIPLPELTRLLTDPYKGFFSSYSGSTAEELALYLAKREKRRIVLLVDDADSLGPVEATLRELVKHPNIVVAVAGRAPSRLRDPNVLVTLSRLDHAASIEFVRKRVESVGGTGTHPLSADTLTDLWQDAQGDLHTFLIACQHAAQAAALAPSHGKLEDDLVRTAHEHAKHHEHAGKHAAAPAEPAKRSRFDSLIEGLESPTEPATHKKK